MTQDFNSISTYEQYNELLSEEDGILVYFSHENCNVCKVLKPKIIKLVKDKFPNLKLVYIDTVNTPEIAGQNRIFAVPTILVFLAGKEYVRASRNISIDELERQISRPYRMMFES